MNHSRFARFLFSCTRNWKSLSELVRGKQYTEWDRILFWQKNRRTYFFGTQKSQTYTEFNLLAKRAEDLRAQRYRGFCRDARFVRPHSAWLSRTQNARNTHRFLTEEQKDIFFGTQKTQTYTEFNLLAKRAEDLRAQWCTQIFLGAHRNHRLTQNFDRST